MSNDQLSYTPGMVDARSVSVLVPTYNSESVIGDCLRSIRDQTLSPYEVIVSDGGSTDSTIEIAKDFGAIVIQMEANRSAQRNAAAERASGNYLLFIDSDMRLHENVLFECGAAMTEDVAALVIPEIFVGQGFWSKVRGFERTFYDDIWYLEAARFYRRDQFLLIHGFDARMVGPEDWDLDQRVRQHGSVDRTTSPIYHHEGKTDLLGILRKKAHYSNSFPLFRETHPSRASLSLSLRNRIRLFLGNPVSLCSHPLLACGIALLGASEIAVAKGWVGGHLKMSYAHEKAHVQPWSNEETSS